jgi:hypothetical protein
MIYLPTPPPPPQSDLSAPNLNLWRSLRLPSRRRWVRCLTPSSSARGRWCAQRMWSRPAASTRRWWCVACVGLFVLHSNIILHAGLGHHHGRRLVQPGVPGGIHVPMPPPATGRCDFRMPPKILIAITQHIPSLSLKLSNEVTIHCSRFREHVRGVQHRRLRGPLRCTASFPHGAGAPLRGPGGG